MAFAVEVKTDAKKNLIKPCGVEMETCVLGEEQKNEIINIYYFDQ